jgi:hypothetical protein
MKQDKAQNKIAQPTHKKGIMALTLTKGSSLVNSPISSSETFNDDVDAGATPLHPTLVNTSLASRNVSSLKSWTPFLLSLLPPPPSWVVVFGLDSSFSSTRAAKNKLSLLEASADDDDIEPIVRELPVGRVNA